MCVDCLAVMGCLSIWVWVFSRFGEWWWIAWCGFGEWLWVAWVGFGYSIFPQCLHLAVDPVHCSRDLQTSFFNKIFIKNGSHSNIHAFKNYFATVFLVFSNKWYPIRPVNTCCN